MVRLALIECEGGETDVCAVDADGAVISYLIIFLPNGKFRRCRGVDPALGFQLDALGRIKLVGEP